MLQLERKDVAVREDIAVREDVAVREDFAVFLLYRRVVDRHHVDADPDPIFYFDSDPIPDPVPTPHFGKSKIVLNLFVYNSFTLFIFLRRLKFIVFNMSGSILKFSGNKSSLALHLIEMHTGRYAEKMPIRLDPDPQHWCTVILSFFMSWIGYILFYHFPLFFLWKLL